MIFFVEFQLGSQNPSKQIYQKTHDFLECVTQKAKLLLVQTSVPIVYTACAAMTELKYFYGDRDPNALRLMYLAS